VRERERGEEMPARKQPGDILEETGTGQETHASPSPCFFHAQFKGRAKGVGL